MSMFEEAISIFALKTCAPSSKSPFFIPSNKLIFSATLRLRKGLSVPALVGVPF